MRISEKASQLWLRPVLDSAGEAIGMSRSGGCCAQWFMTADATHLVVEAFPFLDGNSIGDASLPAGFRSIHQVSDQTSHCHLSIQFFQMGKHLRHHRAGMGAGWIADEIDQMERIDSPGHRIEPRCLPWP